MFRSVPFVEFSSLRNPDRQRAPRAVGGPPGGLAIGAEGIGLQV